MLGVNAGDSLFAEVRDQHVEKFGSFLQNQAMALRESHANFTNKGTKKDLSEIHQFVKQIPVSHVMHIMCRLSVFFKVSFLPLYLGCRSLRKILEVSPTTSTLPS
jgi:hypothetical protein